MGIISDIAADSNNSEHGEANSGIRTTHTNAAAIRLCADGVIFKGVKMSKNVGDFLEWRVKPPASLEKDFANYPYHAEHKMSKMTSLQPLAASEIGVHSVLRGYRFVRFGT